MIQITLRRTALAVALFSTLAASAVSFAAPAAGAHELVSAVEAPAYQLRISGPAGFLLERTYLNDEPMLLDQIQGRVEWTSGVYYYEIVPIAGMAVRREQEQEAHTKALGAGLATTSGTFRVEGGEIVVAQTKGEPLSDFDVVTEDQVIPDDLIVQGSICVGFDCVNNESFGFDTIRLKENNTRIKFEDTSTGTFPSNDWQLTANDSASGGANKFSIEDITGARVPFTITAGAATNSIFVDSTGRVGFRTSTPVLDLHVSDTDTPALRLEQTNAGGFTAQTWDIAGNEANFFVRDVTGGSRLSFRIRPGAPTSSIDISASGNVGMGTASPAAALDVSRPGDAAIRISNSNTTGFTNDWDIKNNAATGRLTFSDDPAGTRVPFKFAPNAVDNLLRIGVLATNTVDINGNLLVTGTITPDYVFEPGFDLPTIEAHADFMWKNKHLPKVAPAVTNEEGKGVIDVAARSQGVLEELEYAHIYIEQLHVGVEALKAENAANKAEIAELRAALDRVLEQVEKR